MAPTALAPSVTRPMEIDGTTAGVTVVVNNLTLENGNGAGSGANDSNDGGGLLVYAENGTHAMVTLNTCTITGNTAAYNGGGIYNDGYYNGDANLTLADCTVTGNTALGTYGYGYGGGIANYGYYNGDATLTLTNTTVTGNTGSNAGGIYNYSATIIGTVLSSAVHGNTATNTTAGAEGSGFL